MTINFGEVCLAVIICTIITIVLYIASWYNHEEKDVREILLSLDLKIFIEFILGETNQKT